MPRKEDFDAETYARHLARERDFRRQRRRLLNGEIDDTLPAHRLSRERAAYDPRRDDPPEWDSLTAMILGDPPRGRRELLERIG